MAIDLEKVSSGQLQKELINRGFAVMPVSDVRIFEREGGYCDCAKCVAQFGPEPREGALFALRQIFANDLVYGIKPEWREDDGAHIVKLSLTMISSDGDLDG